MHGGSHRHLCGFQVQPACLAEILKDDSEQSAYLAFDFLADRFGRFFSRGDEESSTGRARHIRAFTST
jgi:hypothetical protein